MQVKFSAIEMLPTEGKDKLCKLKGLEIEADNGAKFSADECVCKIEITDKNKFYEFAILSMAKA